MALVPSTDMNQLKAKLRQFSSGFSAGQKAVTAIAVLVALVAVIFVASSMGKPTYSVLFSGLQGKDAAKITQLLTSQKIPYQLQDGGATILVPANDVSSARLDAAETDLPSQGTTVGLTILTKTGLTTSQITQQADYLQAIQGELEKTIDGITGVESSQVNVAEPAEQTFALSNTAPTGASVLVTMAQGHTLTDGQVQAIVHLVSSSVPDLSSSDVTVANSDGSLLAGPGVTASASSSSATAAYDTTVAAKVAAYLASVVGPNNADVQVDATLAFTKQKTTTKQIAPAAKGAKTSFCTTTSLTKTTYTGKAANAVGGAAGTITKTATTTTGGKYTQTKTSKSCETGTVTTTVTKTPGAVLRQSVAVIVNKTAVPKGTTLAAIKKGVSAAANLDKARGDVLAFSVVPFSSAASEQAAAAAKAAAATASKAKLGSYAKDAIALLAVLAIFFILWRSSKKRKGQHVAYEPATFAPYVPPALSDPTQEVPAVAFSPRPTAQIEELIENQPGEMATFLREWMQRSGGEGGIN